jgi:hypothetical protein
MTRTVRRFEKEVQNAKIPDLLCLWFMTSAPQKAEAGVFRPVRASDSPPRKASAGGGMLPATNPPYMSKDWQ